MEMSTYLLDEFSSDEQSFGDNEVNEENSSSSTSPKSSATSSPSPKQSTTSSISSSTSRRKFTEEEDKLLSKLVSEMGPRKWDQIAKNMPNNRTARQCRDRYSNYLIPGFFNGEWSKEEDELLYKKYQEFGPKWAVIKEYFTNRSPNAIKNRWNYFVSRSSSIASTVNAEKKAREDAGKQTSHIFSPPTIINPAASAPLFPIWPGQNYIPQQQLSPVQAEMFSNGYSTIYGGVNCGFFTPNHTNSIQLTVPQNTNIPCQFTQGYQMIQNNNFNNYNRCNMAYCNNFAIKPNVAPKTETAVFEQNSSVSSSPNPSDLEDESGTWDVDDQADNLFDGIDTDVIANDDDIKISNFSCFDTNESELFSFY